METSLCRLFRESSADCVLPWEILWVNVSFRFPTAEWFVREMGSGEWSTSELRAHLCRAMPRLSVRTVSNAIMELVGLLERTPVGEKLKQGKVIPSRPRLVIREGLKRPDSRALLYAARELYALEGQTTLSFAEQHLWPWTIFGCTLEDVFIDLEIDGRPWIALEEDHLRYKLPLEDWRNAEIF